MQQQYYGKPSVTKAQRIDEQYRFLRLYVIDLDGVKHSLRILRRYRRKDIRYLILREIIVSYGRPFAGNRGHFTRKHKARQRSLNRSHRSLHERLLSYRNQLLAHTDLLFHSPQVSRLARPGEVGVFPLSFRRMDYEYLEAKLSEIAELVELVEAYLKSEARAIEVAAFPSASI